MRRFRPPGRGIARVAQSSTPRARSRRGTAEDGIALILALALIALLGVFVTAVLTLGYASFKTTEVARDTNKNLYGADGGVDVAAQLLRASSSYCPEVTGTAQSMPTQTIGGRTVSLTCRSLSGSSGGTGGSTSQWALIATGYPSPGGAAADLTRAIRFEGSTHANYVTANGPVFSAGNLDLTATSPEFRINSDFYQYNDTPTQYCDADKATAPSLGNPTVTGTWNCAPSSSYPVPDPSPSLVVPTTTAPTQSGSSSSACQVLFPGRYTTANAPTFNRLNATYLASGVYYFDNVGVLGLAGEIFGGAPPAGETQDLAATPCSNDANANALRPGSATGQGVTLILGGNSRLSVDDHFKTKIELFTRVPANPASEGTAGVTVYAPRTSGSNWSASTGTPIITMAGNKTTMTLHGLFYAPAGAIDKIYAVSNPGSAPLFQGGLVGQRMTIRFDLQANGETFSNLSSIVTSSPATTRTIVVTATATAPSGGAPTTVTAVVQLGTGSGTPATILSWRKT